MAVVKTGPFSAYPNEGSTNVFYTSNQAAWTGKNRVDRKRGVKRVNGFEFTKKNFLKGEIPARSA
jgi:hypothetical protein